jgi:hypothetical protein
MAECELALHLERPDRSYAPGERIRGHVSVTVRSALEAKGLYVRLQWRTHGRCSVRSGPETEVKLSEGSWPAGFNREYGFEFEAPAGPATYRGKLMSVDHFLTARVESGWTLAGHAETVLVLAPPPPGAPYDRGPAAQAPAAALKTQSEESAIAAVLVGLLVGAPGLGILLLGIASLLGLVRISPSRLPGPPGVFYCAFGALLVALAAGGVFLLQRWKLARRKLGDPVVEIVPVEVRRGELVRLGVTLQPPGDVELAGASIVLKGRERANTPADNNRLLHEFHRSAAALSASRRLQSGQSLRLVGEIRVPADAPPSFDADSAHVEWALELTLEPAGWPGWVRDFPIVVWP